MNKHENDQELRLETRSTLTDETMYEKMLERLYLTSSTRYIPRYTLEAARLRFFIEDQSISRNESEIESTPSA